MRVLSDARATVGARYARTTVGARYARTHGY